MKPANSGCGSNGFDFSPGWYCTPTNQGWPGSSMISGSTPSGDMPEERTPVASRQARKLTFTKRRLQHRLRRGSQEVAIPLHMPFEIDDFALTFAFGHGVPPRNRVGDVRHHPHTMAARPQPILQNKPDTTRRKGSWRCSGA